MQTRERINLPPNVNDFLRSREKRLKGLTYQQIERIKDCFALSIILEVKLSQKYTIGPQTFQTLLIVWLNPCSSTFKIWQKQRGLHRSCQLRLQELMRLNLIEIIGSGNRNCPLYCVSPLFLSELEALCSA